MDRWMEVWLVDGSNLPGKSSNASLFSPASQTILYEEAELQLATGCPSHMHWWLHYMPPQRHQCHLHPRFNHMLFRQSHLKLQRLWWIWHSTWQVAKLERASCQRVALSQALNKEVKLLRKESRTCHSTQESLHFCEFSPFFKFTHSYHSYQFLPFLIIPFFPIFRISSMDSVFNATSTIRTSNFVRSRHWAARLGLGHVAAWPSCDASSPPRPPRATPHRSGSSGARVGRQASSIIPVDS